MDARGGTPLQRQRYLSMFAMDLKVIWEKSGGKSDESPGRLARGVFELRKTVTFVTVFPKICMIC
jgi:hypothetical protein